MPMPTIVGVGTAISGLGAVVVPYPAGYTAVANDVAIIFREMEGADIGSTPSGYATLVQQPVTSGTTTKLNTVWKRLVAGEAAPSCGDPGDHQVGQMIVVRGCVGAGNPWNVATPTQELVADTSVSIAAVTTTQPDSLILVAFSTGQDVASTAGATSWTNASLVNLTERMDVWVVDGLGGGFAMASGEKAVAGSTGATTATLLLTANFKAMVAIALTGTPMPALAMAPMNR